MVGIRKIPSSSFLEACCNWKPTSPLVQKKHAPGPSNAVRMPHKRLASSTVILNAASSAPKPSLIMTTSPTTVNKARKKQARCVQKARPMSFRMATLCTSCSTPKAALQKF